LLEASNILKQISTTKFDASVDIDVRLGVDPRQANQMVRGVASLPHGLGKVVRTLVLCTSDKEQEARDAGADHVGLDDYIEKIAGGWTDIDIIIAVPSVMAKLGRLGKILGPRNLMPNPKSGTVVPAEDLTRTIKEVRGGRVEFRNDKTGLLHVGVGKVSFSEQQITENISALMEAVKGIKPSSIKGTFVRSVTFTSTMGPGIPVDPSAAQNMNA